MSTELKLPQLSRSAKGHDAKNHTNTSYDEDEFLQRTSTPKHSPKTAKNPFRIPTDEEIIIMREEQHRKNMEDRERMKDLKIHEKTTQTFKNSNTNKLYFDDEDVPSDHTVSQSRLAKSQPTKSPAREGRTLSRSDASKRGGSQEHLDRPSEDITSSPSAMSLTSVSSPISSTPISSTPISSITFSSATRPATDTTLTNTTTNNKATSSMSNSMNGSRGNTSENLTQFVASKREMFLMSYSLTVKRDEMKKLSSLALDREEALCKAEKMLEEDTARFDAFLKENNLKTMEATKRADAETKAKLDKVAEIKRYTLQMGTIKNEMAKYDEQLEDCKKYKEFLDKLTPVEWINEKASQMSLDPQSASVDTMYFTKPEQLLSIFKSLEESNMFLIQNSQETEKMLEELHHNLKETALKLDEETNSLKAQISMLEEAIKREDTSWSELEEKAFKNFGIINVTTQESILQDLHQKVLDVYSSIVDLSTTMNTTTLAMLTNIEYYMEDLFKQQATLPASYLSSAIKMKDKERRIKQRAEKMEKQKIVQELRIKKSLERAQAPIKQKDSKPVMFRSVLPKESKKQQQITTKDQSKEEEELHYFGLL